MPLLLTPEGKRTLRSLNPQRLLLATDFDGTLVPHAPPGGVLSLSAQTGFLLQSLKKAVPLAVITGRSHADILRFIDPALCLIAGNYGIEAPWVPQEERDSAAAVTRQIFDALRATEGIQKLLLEDKTYSLTMHEKDERVLRTLSRDLQKRMASGAFPLCRLLMGIGTLNLVPAGAPTKADALIGCMKAVDRDHALFIGDDVPDEEAFAVPGTLGVRIGYSRSSSAAFHLSHQGEVDTLLTFLCDVFGVDAV